MAGQLEHTSPGEDRKLISAIMAGDQQAFRLLVQQYERLVVSIVFKMVKRVEDREDLCQDVFMAVYHKLVTFRFQSKLSTWIGNIAYNKCVNFLEKTKLVLAEDHEINHGNNDDEGPLHHRMENVVADENPHPEQLFLNKELKQQILESLETLPVIQRTIISLFHQLEFSLEEIGGITNLPVNTVKSHLFRGRKALKAQLKNL